MPGRVELAVLVAAMTACYSPPEPDCGFVCGPAGECPADYTCAGDNICHLDSASPSVVCAPTTLPFNVESVTSTGNQQLTIIFDAAPDVSEASIATNYTVEGLTLDAPFVEGTTVIVQTSPQSPIEYTVIVSNITRASDSATLKVDTGTFTGRSSFNVTSAVALTAQLVAVTFDAPPDPIAASDPQNYVVNEQFATGVSLAGDVATVQFPPQGGGSAFVLVNDVTRASDLEPLTVNGASFTSIIAFTVVGAASVSNTSMSVTFSDPPDPASATTLANYSVGMLALSGTPVLVGNTVTITTEPQLSFVYTVTVSNVTRGSDGEPLDSATAQFDDPSLVPTITNVVVEDTTPDNGTTPYTTGTTTVVITGTNFSSVVCPLGIQLDDLDGAGDFIGTPSTTLDDGCSVDSDTQITATFPRGIRTNGSIGWPVQVTNEIGTASSSVPFVPVAGILISEVYVGTTAGEDHEFIELYNPTGANVSLLFNALHLHVVDANGLDTDEPVTMINDELPSHRFYLLASSTSDAGDVWFAHRDATYPAALVSNGGVYISTSATSQANVLDKVGWGTQAFAFDAERTALPDIPTSQSVQRKPAGGAGAATDTDDNAADFTAASAAITPLGTVDPPQP